MKTLILRLLKKIYLSFNKYHLSNKKKVSFGPNSNYSRNTVFEGNNHLSTNSSLINSYIGRASYVSTDCFIINTKIGKYSSIGPYLKCILGNHPTNTYVSTHPAFFSTRKQSGFTYVDEQGFDEFAPPIEPGSNYTIEIGNDVWIGARVTLIDGVKIGNGAIVASGALVNKDVPAYTMVGGIPAKPIKKRFSDEQIRFLNNLEWWNRDEDWIKNNVEYFNDIESFIKNLK